MFRTLPKRLLFTCVTALMAMLAVVQTANGAGLGLPVDIVDYASTGEGTFPLASQETTAPICYDPADWAGVIRAVGDLQSDIERVTGTRPAAHEDPLESPHLVIVGTVGKSAPIDELIRSGKLDAADLTGKWESFVITTIKDPLPGVGQALVIAGSDKRGTIYGIYELSEQMGVSPWYWWADVPTQHRDHIYIKPGRYASGEPVVRYRGIFLNDERPCLTEWTREQFGGMNHQFYTKVFELLLRLRANYLWPAMWDNAFNEDDPENPRLADEYGIVMGTSHHEPMMRAHKEWQRRSGNYGNGQWNYRTNSEALQRFFREGVARNGRYENLVTIGMRGDGDVGMVSTGSMESDIALLKKIMSDQRQILQEELGRDPRSVPQLWALFTEVQSYYEQGLRPPEDVTLLWTDDNTGNLRRLPTAEERLRSGGAGIYYHIDMHGGPFSYQWINTSPLPKIAEQFHLAYEYDATRIWVVNVGDLKPLEVPIEFIMRMAWNPAAMTKDDVADYTRRWAAREFGKEHAADIAEVVSRYAKYNGWRKPELTTPDTFSQLNYEEAERIEAAWIDVADKAQRIYEALAPEYLPAFYQLVLHPAKASSIVARMNIAAGRNNLYARQGRASTNALAEETRALFREDQSLTDYYNHKLSGGKWNHLMDQTHIGQHTWEPPTANMMPPVSEVLPPDSDRYGLAIEGDMSAWPDHFGDAVLPLFDSLNPCRSYVDVYAMGTQPIDYSIQAEEPWIRLTLDASARPDHRYWVKIDWNLVPEGVSRGRIVVRSPHRTPFGDTMVVYVPVHKATQAQHDAAKGRFASLSGTIALDPTQTLRRTEVGGVHWEEIPDYGRVDAAMGIYPVTASSIEPPARAPTLEYPLYLPESGTYQVSLVLGPVVNFVPNRGMRIAVSVDEQEPQVLDLFPAQSPNGTLRSAVWPQYTSDNAHYLITSCTVEEAGQHVLKIAMVDPGIVVQKIILSGKKIPVSYFGPPNNELVK